MIFILVNMGTVVFLLFLLTASISAAKLPSYLKPCKLGKDFKECAIKNGQQAISSIVKGDRSYKVPNMLPLKIPQIFIDASNLKINLKNNDVYGLENTIVKDIDFDFEKQNSKVTVMVPVITLIGQYDIDGKILVLPLRGSGPANITFSDSLFNYSYTYELIEKNGDRYQNITKSDCDYKVSRAWFKLDNLFDGNKRLGDEMNNFMNENWREVLEDLGPALSETVGQIITTILSQIIKKVPHREIFIE